MERYFNVNHPIFMLSLVELRMIIHSSYMETIPTFVPVKDAYS
jgi:hypothetical protein